VGPEPSPAGREAILGLPDANGGHLQNIMKGECSMPEPTKSSPPVRDARGYFLPGHPIGAAHRWRNVSGNPAGSPKARREFEQVFYAALLAEGSAEEAAQLLWKAARNQEPWAIQCLLQRLAPQVTQVKLTHEVDNGGFDFTKLSDGELRQLAGILERAAGATPELAGGDLPALPEGLHQDGLADS
jgi:hypothetical protein